MKVLAPTSNEQVISIIPRKSDIYLDSDYESRVTRSGGTTENSQCVSNALSSLNNISMTIVMDGRKKEETINDLRAVFNGNYIDFYFSSNIMEEGFIYAFEMKKDENLYYRDKFYVTTQNNYEVKHKESQLNYKEYNESDENRYIIR